jgi:hypothetical protein
LCKESRGNLIGTEFIFGPTNINATTANGSLAVGISERGEITVLRWPSPSFFDHIKYRTAMFNEEARLLPYFGADPNMGAFAGIYIETEGVTEILWLRDHPGISPHGWNHKQRYLNDESAIVQTEYTNKNYGITVIGTDFVLWDMDVLIRNYLIRFPDQLRLKRATFIHFQNLSPCVRRIPNRATTDWLEDHKNDFATVYDPRTDTVITFILYDENADFGPFLDLFSSEEDVSQIELSEFVDSIDETFGEGVYIAVGLQDEDDAYQVGMDAFSECPQDITPVAQPMDAYYDSFDGELSLSPLAVCRTNSALAKSIYSTGVYEYSITVIFAFGNRIYGQGGVIDLIESVRKIEYEHLLHQTIESWRDWVEKANLPDTKDEEVLRISKRALISIRNGWDRNLCDELLQRRHGGWTHPF